jgi:hypothetical protein
MGVVGWPRNSPTRGSYLLHYKAIRDKVEWLWLNAKKFACSVSNSRFRRTYVLRYLAVRDEVEVARLDADEGLGNLYESLDLDDSLTEAEQILRDAEPGLIRLRAGSRALTNALEEVAEILRGAQPRLGLVGCTA